MFVITRNDYSVEIACTDEHIIISGDIAICSILLLLDLLKQKQYLLWASLRSNQRFKLTLTR